MVLLRLNARKMEQESLKAAQMAETTAALVSKESSSSLGSLPDHEFNFPRKIYLHLFPFFALHDASSKGSSMDQLQTLPMGPQEPLEEEPLVPQPLEPQPKAADLEQPLHDAAGTSVKEVQPLATEVRTEEAPAEAAGQKPSAQPPLLVVATEKIAELAEAEEKLDEEAAATAAEAEAFRRQQLQMKLDEKEKAEAARNAKKEAKEVKEPKPKGKAKGRPRKTDGDEKESKAPAKKKQRASADDAAEPAGAATEPVAPSTPPKRKAAADGEQKVKKPRAKKQKVGNMDVDEDLVSEFLSMMHKFDGCVYDKSFDALYKHLALNWKT